MFSGINESRYVLGLMNLRGFQSMPSYRKSSMSNMFSHGIICVAWRHDQVHALYYITKVVRLSKNFIPNHSLQYLKHLEHSSLCQTDLIIRKT